MNRNGKNIQLFGFMFLKCFSDPKDFSLMQGFLMAYLLTLPCSLEMLVSVEKLFRLGTVLENVFLKSKYCMECFNRVIHDFVETRNFLLLKFHNNYDPTSI